MDLFEKVEKLREKADVSYEDAKAALDQANGDILDAMIILEKEGKTKAPSKEAYSTRYEDNKQLPVEVIDVEENRSEKNERRAEKREEFKRKMYKLWVKLRDNFLVVARKDEQILKLPLWVFLLIILIGWHIVPIIMIIALFFGCHYSFVGIDEMKGANNVMNKADEMVEHVKDEYNKL